MRTLLLFISSLMLIFASCKSEAGKAVKDAAETAKDKVENVADKAADTAKDLVKKYKITPFAASTAYPDAKIDKVEYKNGKFNFGVSNYELGAQTPDAGQKMCANSAKGQHIHLIVGTDPYAAKYTADFDYDIPDGEHHMLAFLSRSYHESIKTPTASFARKVSIKGKSIAGTANIEGPTLFYSRPKGTYIGKANTEKVMLDFYLVNAQLGDNFKVQADINGETHLLDKWQPYYIEGLPIGENTVKLTLLDKDGKPVASPINPVTRKFTLKADELEK